MVVSTLTLGTLVALFLLILKLGDRTSAVVADTENSKRSLGNSGGKSSVSRAKKPKPKRITDPPLGSGQTTSRSLSTSNEKEEGENSTNLVQKGIPKAPAQVVNRIFDIASSKDDIQARSEIDNFRENWKKATEGDFSNMDPKVRELVVKGEKSADMIIEEQAKNELKQALIDSKSSIPQVQEALDKYHAVAKHLNIKEMEIAAIGGPTKAENLCEVRLRELSRKVKDGTPVTQEIIDEAILLLRAPGEFMSLGLAGRLNIVDNIKKTPQETLEKLIDVDLAEFNDYYEGQYTSDMCERSEVPTSGPSFSFSGFECLDVNFKKDSRIEDMQEILNTSVAADSTVVQKFIQACSKLEHLVPPHFLLEEVCQQLDSEPEILSRFIDRYIMYGFKLKSTTAKAILRARTFIDKKILSKAEKKNRIRMEQAFKLREAIHLKINPSITDKGITESSEWKKFVDNPKDRSVFINLLKKLESLGLKAAAMKHIAADMILKTKITELSTYAPEYKHVRAIDALCDLFSRDVSSEEQKYYDILKKHYFDMKQSEALDAFYQLLRLNKSICFEKWEEIGTSLGCFGFREDRDDLDHDIFKLIALIINASFEQEGALSALVLVVTLEEIIKQSPELSVPFRNLPDKLLEAIKDTNAPLQILRDFHATITDNLDRKYSELSTFYMEIVNYASPNSFLALDYNMHRMNYYLSQQYIDNSTKLSEATLNRESILKIASANSQNIHFIRSAVLAQKAYEDKNFLLGLPTYIQKIDIDDVNFAEAVQNLIIGVLDRKVFKQDNPSPYVLAEKQLLEGARDEVYNIPAASINTVEKLFKYVIEDPFMKKFDDCGALDKGYNLSIKACGLSLLDSKLTLSVLEQAGIAKYDSMVAYLHLMALKHAKVILSDKASRGKLISRFTVTKGMDFGGGGLDELRDNLPLKRALKSFLNQARMGDEKNMNPEIRAMHDQIYTPLLDNPEAYKKQLDEDLSVAEEHLKKVFKTLMKELALKFLFPPTLQIGSIYVPSPETRMPTEHNIF